MLDMNVEEFELVVRECCTLTTDDMFARLVEVYGFTLTHHGSETWGKSGRMIHNRYAYRPGKYADSPLLVCHADTVLGNLSYSYDSERMVVTSSELDDRLGIACMLYSLLQGNALSECAMLVCDNEEIASTTASTFTDDTLAMNGTSEAGLPVWLMEFDRRGTDAVTYVYGNDTFHSLLESVGFTIGEGSFSDISSMTDIGRSGVNVGIGYHNEHSTRCHARLSDTLTQLGRAVQFCEFYSCLTLRYTPPAFKRGKYDRTNYDGYYDDDRPLFSSTGAKLSLTPIVDDMWDSPLDELDELLADEASELEVCECCEAITHEQDMLDFGGQRICEQCYADFVSPNSLS
jgi:hypothetical protein